MVDEAVQRAGITKPANRHTFSIASPPAYSKTVTASELFRNSWNTKMSRDNDLHRLSSTTEVEETRARRARCDQLRRRIAPLQHGDMGGLTFCPHPITD